MKRTILTIAILALISAAPGCLHRNTRPSEGQCGCGGGAGCGGLLSGLGGGPISQEIQATQGWRHQAPEVGPAGPPTGAYAYPYYTLRGPRDFLTDNPPSIGN
jgi:hypothetical protein